MQFTINILIFILGFYIAIIVESKPKHVRSTLNDLFRKLRYITNAVRPGAPRKEAIVAGQERLVQLNDVGLWTK